MNQVSAVLHGVLLLFAVLLFPKLLNLIPALAAILLVVGYKLAKPAMFKAMYYSACWIQFAPFMTVIGILLTDLLGYTALGMGVAIFLFPAHQFATVVLSRRGTPRRAWRHSILHLSEDRFLPKPCLHLQTLDAIRPTRGSSSMPLRSVTGLRCLRNRTESVMG